jgi:hypothetical protein
VIYHHQLMGRRKAATLLTAVLLASPFGDLLASITAPSVSTTARLKRMLLALFTDPWCAYSIGTAFARTMPEAARSADLLAAAFLTEQPAAFATIDELRASILMQIHGDFAEGRVVNVDGWLLAVTEARLCALVTLAV